MPVHYSFILHTDDENLEYILRSWKLHKITKKLIGEAHRVQQAMWKISIKQTERDGMYVSIHWRSIFHYKKGFPLALKSASYSCDTGD